MIGIEADIDRLKRETADLRKRVAKLESEPEPQIEMASMDFRALRTFAQATEQPFEWKCPSCGLSCGTRIIETEFVGHGARGADIKARFVCECAPCKLSTEATMSFDSRKPEDKKQAKRISDWIERHTR